MDRDSRPHARVRARGSATEPGAASVSEGWSSSMSSVSAASTTNAPPRVDSGWGPEPTEVPDDLTEDAGAGRPVGQAAGISRC